MRLPAARLAALAFLAAVPAATPVARFDWAFSENASLLLGYRVLDVDYASGRGVPAIGT